MSRRGRNLQFSGTLLDAEQRGAKDREDGVSRRDVPYSDISKAIAWEIGWDKKNLEMQSGQCKTS
jgi:hypothetical protein